MKKRSKSFFKSVKVLLIPLVFALQVNAQPVAQPVETEQSLTQLKGLVREKGTKIPLKDVNVNLVIQPLSPNKISDNEKDNEKDNQTDRTAVKKTIKVTTNQKGEFIAPAVPEGDVQVILVLPGYLRYDEVIQNNKDSQDQTWQIFVERETYSEFETRIVSQKDKRDVTRRGLKQSEFTSVPGANGDPVKAVQNLPGVNRVAGFSSQVVIQGSAPGDTRYDIDGHEIPLVFHFGGLTSVLMPESIDRVDYLSAGFGSEYSRALGGIVSLKTRNPDVENRDKKGFFFIDTLKSGALIEGKIDDDSDYLFSARYSYIGVILKQVLKNNDQFNLTVAPEFADITGIYRKRLSESENLKVVATASRDTLQFLFKEPVRQDPSIRGSFFNETSFFRLIPQYTKKIDSDRQAQISLGVGQDKIDVEIGERFFHLNSRVLTARGEWEQRLNAAWKSQLGFDNQYSWSNVDVKLPIFRSDGGVSNPISVSETREVSITGRTSNIGVYWRNEITPESSKFTWMPQLRGDYFKSTKESLLSPRFAGKYQLNQDDLIRGAAGLYYQPPTPQEVDQSFGNENVKSPRAYHFSLGLEQDLRGGKEQGFTLNTGLFWKEFDRLVIQSSNFVLKNSGLQPEIYNNEGKGRAQGVEILLKYDGNPWTGWLSYTLSKSTRWNPNRDETLFEYDQTHNVNLVAGYQFPRDWKLSGRFRYVTGNPTTPVVGGVFDADNDVYIPKRGPIFSERLKDFTQLDLRLDKKVIDQKAVWSMYLDVQNVLNTQNAETVRYSYDYKVKEDISGLPILPSIGVKGEF